MSDFLGNLIERAMTAEAGGGDIRPYRAAPFQPASAKINLDRPDTSLEASGFAVDADAMTTPTGSPRPTQRHHPHAAPENNTLFDLATPEATPDDDAALPQPVRRHRDHAMRPVTDTPMPSDLETAGQADIQTIGPRTQVLATAHLMPARASYDSSAPGAAQDVTRVVPIALPDGLMRPAPAHGQHAPTDSPVHSQPSPALSPIGNAIRTADEADSIGAAAQSATHPDTARPTRVIAQPRVSASVVPASPALQTQVVPMALAAQTAQAQTPTIHVTIGRVEVRAVPSTSPGKPAQPTRGARTMTLADYVREHDGGKR